MQKRIAQNLNQLSSDGSTVIDGRVTGDDINNKINDVYREELFPLLSDKYPKDFEQETYPQATYTATSTIASVDDTTLTVDDAIFNNSMEGFEIENPDEDSKIEIATYTSTTEVEMDSSVDDWNVGDTIYVLGNIFTFGGDTADLKEVIKVGLKYNSGDTYFKTCQRSNRERLFAYGSETYNEINPYFFLTSQDVNSRSRSAIGFEPKPSSYEGQFFVRYVERPSALGETDEPILNTPGISQIIIEGVTAWGFAVLEKWKSEAIHLAKYERGKAAIKNNYKPKSRSGATIMKLPSSYRRLISREV